MITFNVVKEQDGWGIRMGQNMTTHFWSKDLAICEAKCLAAAIRQHGVHAEVVVEGADADEAPKSIKLPKSLRLDFSQHWV